MNTIEAISTDAGSIPRGPCPDVFSLPAANDHSTDKQGACKADKEDGCASAIALTNGLFIIG